MATKDFSFSTKKKKTDSYFNNSSNDKYRNLNLNLGHKYSENCFGETKSSKFGLKNNSYKFSGTFNSFKEEKNKSLFDSDKSWKTSFQLKQDPFGSRYSNISKIKDNKKSKNAFDSRDRRFSFSDHIQKNMHFYESPAADDEILSFKKDKKKFKNAIDRCLSSSPDLQASWEFPRQQEDVVPQDPEVMNFKASQKLLRPSQEDKSPNDQLGPSADDFAAAFAREQSEIADNKSLVGKKFVINQKKSFTVTSELGRGSFGAVYECEDENGAKYAIKCSSQYDLNIEIEILKKANEAKTKHICRMINSGIYDGQYFVVIDLLGPSLAEKFEDKKGVEWDPLKWKVAEQCIIGLQNLHGLGYLHLDLKQNNFAMGLGENAFMVYLIDFGLSLKSCSVREPSDSINGIFKSIAAMKGNKLGPKDDIESLMYMIKQLLGGQLPWEDQVEDEEDEEPKKIFEPNEVLQLKQDLRNDESDVFKRFFGEPQSIFGKDSAKKNIKKNQLPEEAKTFPELLKILRYVDSLKAEEIPCYDKIFYFLHSAYEKAQQKADMKYEKDKDKIKCQNARTIFENKNVAKNDELKQILKHCKTNVKKPENMAFFTGYDFKEKYKSEDNPKGKYYNKVEYNGIQMMMYNDFVGGASYRHKNNVNSVEPYTSIDVFYSSQPKLGEEAKAVLKPS